MGATLGSAGRVGEMIVVVSSSGSILKKVAFNGGDGAMHSGMGRAVQRLAQWFFT